MTAMKLFIQRSTSFSPHLRIHRTRTRLIGVGFTERALNDTTLPHTFRSKVSNTRTCRCELKSERKVKRRFLLLRLKKTEVFMEEKKPSPFFKSNDKPYI